MSRAKRMSAVGAVDGLSLVRQCALAGVSRSSLYYRPAGGERGKPDADAQDRRVAHQVSVLRCPADALAPAPRWRGGWREPRAPADAADGFECGATAAADEFSGPGTQSVPLPAGRGGCGGAGPGVLRGHHPHSRDVRLFYLVAVMDWATRRVLSWRLSNTVEVGFCLGALEDALLIGTPGIFNTDQGSQFTSLAFTQRVPSSAARMSMDGRGRFMDNIFRERLWRSLKYEAVYLHEFED